MNRKNIFVACLLLFVLSVPLPGIAVYAQTQVNQPSRIEGPDANAISAVQRRLEIVNPSADPARIPSLFFTAWEHALLVEARMGLTARMPDPGEYQEGDQSRPKGLREIALAGIVYVARNDWTVWLNGMRVTPDAIPPEVLDMTVRKEYIELQWYDAYTNQIFPIRLRAHQRFNIDSRIFLPG